MRAREIFAPYHDAIARQLDERKRAGRRTVLISLHSFTPVYGGLARPWQVGVLYNRDAAFARVLLDLLRGERDLTVGDNEPYTVDDETDYTIPVHGEQRGIPHVAIEIRQDLIGAEDGQRLWADRLAKLLPMAAAKI